jgi:hypothetical protein
MVAQYTEQPKWADGDTLEWSGGAHCNLPSLVFNGECQQSVTPTPDNPIPIYSFDGLALVRGRDSYLYTPYLDGIGSYRDNWDYVTGKGIRRIFKKVLDGTEGWSKIRYSVQDNGYYSWRLEMRNIENKTNATANPMAMCTHYGWSGYAALFYGKQEGVYIGGVNDSAAWLIIGTVYPTLAEFKAFLAEQYANGTPVTVYYAMAEPIPFEERSEYDVYEPIPNDSGHIDTIDSSIQPPFRITYITHS